jgi:hypothetical protein
MSNSSVTGSHPRHPSRRQQVLDTLVHHGLTERAARALYRLGLELRRRMLQQPNPALWTERAGTVDAQSGRRLGPTAMGTHNGVDIGPQLRAAQGHRAVSVHTHPASSAFSPQDAQLLIEEAVLEVVAVVAADGTWYMLSSEPGKPPPAVTQIRRRYTAIMQRLLPVYQAIVRLGLATDEQA